MNSLDIEIVDLTEIVGDSDICCDYHEKWSSCPGDPAKWVARTTRCACGFSAIRLICTCCKDWIMAADGAIRCGSNSGCDEVFAPGRLAYSSFEPLERGR